MPTWLALPLIAVVLTYWYAQQSPENHQTVVQYLAIAATWLKWAPATPSTAPNRVAGAGTNLYALATLVVVGMIIGGLIYVIIELARRNGMGKGPVDSTVAKLGAIHRHRGRIPRAFPRDIADVVENVLTVRGGNAEDGGPNFWVERNDCIATPLYWQLPIDYAPGVEPDKLTRMLSNIADRLSRINLNVDPLIEHKPFSIRIANPKPPTFTLADFWAAIKALPQDELLSAGAVTVEAGKMVLHPMSHDHFYAGWLIVGKPRAGKTQFALSTLLSLAMANSPQRLALYIGDVKRQDTHWLSTLPHLAAPIAHDADTIADILAGMVSEMKRRMRQADQIGYNHSRIAIYIDELAAVLEMAGERKAEVESNIMLLLSTGAAAGIIVIMASQRVIAIDGKVFSNANRRCILTTGKVADSNHAIGCKESAGHTLPRGAVSIHDSGNADGEVVRGLYVGETDKPTFAATIAPFLDDIKRRHPRTVPAHPLLVDDEPEPATADSRVDDDHNPTLPPMEQLPDLRGKFGDDLVATWINMALAGDLTTNAIRKATGANGQNGKAIRDRIEAVTTLVKNTHVSESPV